MNRETIELMSSAGAGKLAFSKSSPLRYLCRAMLAGFFIVVGTLISSLCKMSFLAESPGTAAFLGALSFSAALILIVLLGGELFTGANLVMSVSLYERRVSGGGVLRVWAMCYIGNFIGIILLCALIALSGASCAALRDSLMVCLPGKLTCPWYALLLKGALCNFLVCVGVFAGFRLKSEGAKALVIACVITTFIIMGFEHSVANMATFSLAAFLTPNPDFGAMLLNLLWVSLGNILGGAVLCGLPLWLAAEPIKNPCGIYEKAA